MQIRKGRDRFRYETRRETAALRHENCSEGLRTQRQRVTARTQGVQRTSGALKGEVCA